MSNQTKKLVKLQQKWYAKLKKSGFEDIEDDAGRLKSWAGFEFGGKDVNSERSMTLNRAKSEYYSIVRRFLSEYTFESDRDKKIFEKHTQGIGYRKIAKIHKTNKNKIMKLIKDLLKVMYGQRD